MHIGAVRTAWWYLWRSSYLTSCLDCLQFYIKSVVNTYSGPLARGDSSASSKHNVTHQLELVARNEEMRTSCGEHILHCIDLKP